MSASKGKVCQHTHSLYVPADFYVLRAPALPADLFLKLADCSGASCAGCGSPGVGRSFRRFCDVTRPEQYKALLRFIQDAEALCPDIIFAELSYMPPSACAVNVAVCSQVRAYEIVVRVTPSVPLERVIHLEDLIVGVRSNRFYIRSLRLGKEIMVLQNHMLNPAVAPNPCRFLLECGLSRFACLSAFDWGTTASLPFLPRVVYKQIVLSPARWHLSVETIVPAGSGSARTRSFAGLQEWRAAWRVPRYVYLLFMDNRLQLDLEHPLMAAELATEVAKLAGEATITLEELLPDFHHLWLEDEHGAKYFSEIVVPLRNHVPPGRMTAGRLHRRPDLTRIILQKERCAFPGDGWVYLKLYSASTQHDALIAGPLRERVRTILGQDLADRWFYIRYCDTAPHLRIRFHARDAQVVQEILSAILVWSRQQVEAGLASYFSLNTYEPEIERYGGPAALEMIEQVFMADSVTASNLITACYNRQITIDPLAIAIFSLDHLFADWELPFAERLQWTQRHIQKEVNKEFHTQRQLFCDLLAPWEYTRDMALMEQRDMLCKLVAPQKSVLETASLHVRSLAANDTLWVYEDSILQSLAHMHLNRLLGINPQRERLVYTLWRQTLESLSLRPKSGCIDR